VGTTTSFSVTAIGTGPLTCQWRKNGVNLADGVQSSGATISGTTTTDLTIANVQMSDGGGYTVVVTNSYGSVTSSVAALTVQGCGRFIANGFGFDLSGMPGQTVVIEASTNLTAWRPLLTNSLLTGSCYFNDCDSTNIAQRFYRARLTP
jgi:2',3'-cyclic-nucleotide 2'-phosphodiesterase (5'-nucleotidase family)